MQTLIREIYGVWRFERPAGFVARARSTPGHLIHYVASGGYELTADNRTAAVKAGDLIYYYESEDVTSRGGDVPVVFYSVGFDAPSLPPPPLSRRCISGSRTTEEAFTRALDLQSTPATVSAQLELFELVSRIVGLFHDPSAPELEPGQPLWWQIENSVRRQRLFCANLADLCEIAGFSRATVIRACRESTGTTPMRRLRDLRIAEARGLLLYSMSSITDVALQLGYNRIHEFSREFSNAEGMSPSAYRASTKTQAGQSGE